MKFMFIVVGRFYLLEYDIYLNLMYLF